MTNTNDSDDTHKGPKSQQDILNAIDADELKSVQNRVEELKKEDEAADAAVDETASNQKTLKFDTKAPQKYDAALTEVVESLQQEEFSKRKVLLSKAVLAYKAVLADLSKMKNPDHTYYDTDLKPVKLFSQARFDELKKLNERKAKIEKAFKNAEKEDYNLITEMFK